MSRVTMKDVARAAGVDTSTVSLALRSDPRIRSETRQRVEAAAARLGYAVNPLIAAWVRSRRSAASADSQHLSVGYLASHPPGFDWQHNGHFQAIFTGLRTRLEEFGFAVTIFDLNDYRGAFKRLDQVLLTRNIQGLIFGPENRPYRVDDLQWERYSMVTIGYALQSPRVHRVTEDHFLGMQLALERCRAIGGTRIGLAFSKTYNSDRTDRWVAAYLLHGRATGQCLPIFPPRQHASRRTMNDWLGEARPDVILTDAPADWRHAGLPIVCFAISEADTGVDGVHENNRGIGGSAADALIALTFRNERGLPQARKNILVEPGASIPGHPASDLEEFFPPASFSRRNGQIA
jgi:DNA-binding LacI/PurR family transcriptional regulator